MIHGPNILGSYAILIFFSTGLDLYHLTYPQLSDVSALAQSLPSFWSCFSALPQSHIGHLLNWGAHLPVSLCSRDSQSKNPEVVCHFPRHGTTFFQAWTKQGHALQLLHNVPGAPVVSLLVVLEHVNFHRPKSITMTPGGRDKGPAVVPWKRVWGRLEPRLGDPQEERAPRAHCGHGSSLLPARPTLCRALAPLNYRPGPALPAVPPQVGHTVSSWPRQARSSGHRSPPCSCLPCDLW